MDLKPVLTDARSKREDIRQKALEGIKQAFPLKIRNNTLEIKDLVVNEKDFGPIDQKRAILEASSLVEPIKGTVVMKGPDGNILETHKNFVFAHLPYFTERHTFIIGGNEYQVANQIRTKPGVYTRRRGNEELEASFNLSKGSNFRISMDPRRGYPYLEYGSTTIPLYPILRKLGIPHEDIAKQWGSELATTNEYAFKKDGDKSVLKLYSKLVHPSKQVAATPEARVAAIHAAYDTTTMDAGVNEMTLGTPYAKVTPGSLLTASTKLLNVYKNDVDTDDRDSLIYKTYHGVADFIKERIALDARVLAMKTRLRATSKTDIKSILPHAPFTSGLRSFLTTSQLSSIPTQINPMEMIDHAVKVTSLGEGGIASDRGVPMETRQLHATHLGIMDQARTPESFNAGIDIRTAILTHHDEHGNLYTPVKNTKTGQYEYLSTKDIFNSTIAFPGQTLKGLVDVMHKGKVKAIPAKEVQYQLHSAGQMFSPTTNLIPMPESIQGNRLTMSSKHQTQAIPLVHNETPWVQVGARVSGEHGDEMKSFEHIFGRMVVPTAPVAGKVVKIDDQFVYLKAKK